MANAKMCDRCGKFYTIDESYDIEHAYVFLSYSDYANNRRVDLCPDCRKNFSEWYRMDNTKKSINM